jgi:hypothetical protein
MKKIVLCIITLFLISCIGYNSYASDYVYNYESIAAPRPSPDPYKNSNAEPVIGGGWDENNGWDTGGYDLDEPDYYYDTNQYNLPFDTQYQREVGVWALNSADWYLNNLNNRQHIQYNNNDQSLINKAIADVSRHRKYYKQCMGYAMAQSKDIIDSFYAQYQGAQLSRMMIIYSDSLLATCYQRR